jgi:hypothetical protein
LLHATIYYQGSNCKVLQPQEENTHDKSAQ